MCIRDSDYILAEDEPAEIKAAKECLNKPRCIVLSCDYDPLTVMDEMLQPIKVAKAAWLVRRIAVVRECVRNYA